MICHTEYTIMFDYLSRVDLYQYFYVQGDVPLNSKNTDKPSKYVYKYSSSNKEFISNQGTYLLGLFHNIVNMLGKIK